jgi:serine protease AprX
VTGVQGLVGADSERLTPLEIPNYTTSNGTSFSAPQVAGTIALMLEANPSLTPAQVRNILQRTATLLTPYYQYETGAGLLNVHAAVLEASFPSRHIGSWRGTLDRRQVRLISDPPVQFSGTVQPRAIAETTLTIPEGALTASIQIAWPMLSTNDLGLYVYDPMGSLRAQSNAINLAGLNGRRERVVIDLPAAGTWRVVVRSDLAGNGTSQPFVGVLEVGRAEYAVTDLSTMSAALRDEVKQNLRTYTICPIGTRFRPDFSVSRSDLAMSLVVGARVPQYLPGQQTYQDVRGDFSRLFVESVQASPNGAMFLDVTPGGRFRPNDVVTRLTAAIALVRAGGLRSEAEARAGITLPILDGESIPGELRGYVSVAMSEGLLQADTLFRPQAGLTRAELAHAMAIIETRAIQ